MLVKCTTFTRRQGQAPCLQVGLGEAHAPPGRQGGNERLAAPCLRMRLTGHCRYSSPNGRQSQYVYSFILTPDQFLPQTPDCSRFDPFAEPKFRNPFSNNPLQHTLWHSCENDHRLWANLTYFV